jgi:hypothetical protein
MSAKVIVVLCGWDIFDFSTLTTSSLTLIQNAKKFSMASYILKTMQHLSTTAFSLLGRHSIESSLGEGAR